MVKMFLVFLKENVRLLLALAGMFAAGFALIYLFPSNNEKSDSVLDGLMTFYFIILAVVVVVFLTHIGQYVKQKTKNKKRHGQ